MKLSLRRRALIVNGALAVLLVAGVGAAYASLNGEPEPGVTPLTATVTKGTVTSSVSASGSIASANTRSLNFTGSGTVESIKVEVGDRVKKGQVLARLDDTEARENLDAAKASLDAADDADTSTASGYSQYINARNAYRQAGRALDGTVLKAPFAGTVTGVNGTAGGPASGSGGGTGGSGGGSAGTAGSGGAGAGGAAKSTGTASGGSGFVELADTRKLQIVGMFTEADVTRLKVGQPATITFDALTGVSAQGEVSQIDPTAQTDNNVVRYAVTITLKDSPPGVRLGQTASVQVVADQAEDVLTVPTSAVRSAGGQNTVILVRNGQQVPTRVEIGVKGDTTTEIRSGLDQGDHVVRQANPATTGGQQGGFPGLGGARGGGGFGGGGGGGARLGGGGGR
ncbi:hypothetical protein Misp01_70310 [Microtetraspora sp. NBRC 13810]|uniref:efflux RND transporter periplasmic adaptor subunit n=1 Tax=Microtetraspora sp. NBRC 13810 TaxID=3030990 RepID=UPI0024A1A123|nr:HlyD family efflux transporter periplasmic adaptor subunit [Microtetraspora sp. NBRC 13810]GLW11903.1 hypothetical protein Misp01_70310 [Microtetraspora sp. NBRC 13810]